MDRSFGPAIIESPDGTLRGSCIWCQMRVGNKCTADGASRHIPAADNTPEWCEWLDDMLADTRATINTQTPGDV